MERIFFGLAVWNTLILAAAGTTGFSWSPLQGRHLFIGLFAAIFSCLTHCIVMGHLLGAGRAIKEGAKTLDDPQRFLGPNRRLKSKVFPLATFAPLLTVIAAVLGGGADTGSLPPWMHVSAVVGAVALNLAAYPAELRGIRRTSDLIGQINLLLQEEEQMEAMGAGPRERPGEKEGADMH